MSTEAVLIAGAGPVGLTAALALARRGVPVRVFEALPKLSSENRATTFHPPTVEMLDELGVAAVAVAEGLRAPILQYRDRHEGFIAEFDHALLADVTAFPFRLQYEQSELARVLLDHLARHPGATIEFSSPVRDVSQDGTGVSVDVGEGAAARSVRGAYLIGADGAHSAVRHALGIAFEGMTYPERYLRVSTTFPFERHIDRLAFVTYVSDPAEFFALLRIPSSWRATYPIGPAETDEAALDPERVRARLRAIVPAAGDHPVAEAIMYRVHQRVAPTFRVGRVVLAGDAAHLNNPLGGMGLNSGIHDAIVVTDLLASILRGVMPDSKLDAFSDERRRVAVEHVQAAAHRNAQRLQERDPERRRRANDELRATAADPSRARAYLLRSTMLESLQGTSLERYADRRKRLA